MNEKFVKRLSDLLSVKSLVTLVLTAVFAVMALTGDISQEFMTVYAVVIAFYFGTQAQKAQGAADSAADTSGVRAEFNRAQPLDGAAAQSVEGGNGNG